MQCATPVVFIVFNRPEQTRKVFERIAQVRPARLLVIADGPRSAKPNEALICQHVRDIATRVDWPCQLQTNFAAENLGCRRRLVSGLNWAFEHVEQAIILEDDVLVDISFFPFCEEMLSRFAEDSRVSMIGGFNVVQDRLHIESSYYFSHLTHIWGWATWRRSWARYDEHLGHWPAIKAAGMMEEIFDDSAHREYWTYIFDQMHDGIGPDTWDYQWMYTNLINSALSITPRVNLVENIGFGPLATHTTDTAANPAVPMGKLSFPLIHPPAMLALRSMDHLDSDRSGCRLPSRTHRIAAFLKRQMKSHIVYKKNLSPQEDAAK